VRRRLLPRLANIAGASLLSPKLFTEMILEVCDLPQCDYKLGVSRLFLRHRAAQVLESLEPLHPSVLEPLVRSKVKVFWEVASRICDRLLTYFRRRQFREFWRYVLIAQKNLRMWLCQTRYRRMLEKAISIQRAYRTHLVHLREFGRGVRVLQKHVRMWLCQTRYRFTREKAMRIQHAYRAHAVHLNYMHSRLRRAATTRMQACARSYLASRELRRKLAAIGQIQSAYRLTHPSKPPEEWLSVALQMMWRLQQRNVL
jgi:myosin heavy subunit